MQITEGRIVSLLRTLAKIADDMPTRTAQELKHKSLLLDLLFEWKDEFAAALRVVGRQSYMRLDELDRELLNYDQLIKPRTKR